MKLLIATPLYPPDDGGPATYAKTLDSLLPGKDVTVSVVRFGDVRHLPKGIAHFAYMIKLIQASRDCDVILALDPFSVGLPATLVSLFRRKPLVVKIVGDYAWEQGQQRYGVKQTLDEFVKLPGNRFVVQVNILRMIERFVAHRAKRIIVPSQYLKGIVSMWGIEQSKISIVHNAFDGIPELADKETLRKKLSLSGTVFLSVGRLVPWKGFHMLISLMREIQMSIPDAHLLIAGGGPLDGELKRAIRDTHSESFVTMLGIIPHETVMEYMRASDAFVLNTGYEGLSHLLLEVLAVGTPVLTTSVGGNPELIEDNVTGLLVPYNDREALLSGMKKLATDRERSSQLSTKGKEFVAQFTTERMVTGTLEVLKNITGK